MAIPVLGTGNVRRAFISLKGKRVPVTIKLPQSAMPNAEFESQNIMKRIVREAVQDCLLERLHAQPANISAIRIDPKFTREAVHKGVVEAPFEDAQNYHGKDLYVVFSGGMDRAIGFEGIKDGLNEAGMYPAAWIGTSGGALACVSSKDDVYNVVGDHPWTDFLDFNFAGLRDLSTFGGIIRPNKMLRIFERELHLDTKQFVDPDGNPIYVTAGNLRNGKAVMLGNVNGEGFNDGLVFAPEGPRSADFRESFMPAYVGGIPMLDALRYSFSIPIFFEVKDTGQYRFVDGAMKLYCGIKAAANFIDCGRIIAVSLGYTDQPETGKNNCLTDFNGWEDMRSWEQMDSLNHYMLRGLSVRVFNPGLFNVPTPQAYMNAQKLVGSARESFRQMMSIVTPERFFQPWGNDVFQRLAPRFSAKWWGEYRSDNIAMVIDRGSKITTLRLDDPYWEQVVKEDGRRVVSPEPRSILSVAAHDFRESNGTLRMLAAGAYLGAGYALRPWLLKEKKKQGPTA